MTTVRIRRIHPNAVLPKYETKGAAAFDLAACEVVRIAPGEVKLVPTGLVIEVPPGMFLGVFARSSTPLRRGLMVANGVGVVDPDYCGPDDQVKVAVLNFTARSIDVSAGDRLAQGILLPSVRVTWEDVTREDVTREETSAGKTESRGGFGTTG